MRGAARQSQYRGSCGKLGEWREDLAGAWQIAKGLTRLKSRLSVEARALYWTPQPPRLARLTLRLGDRDGLRVADSGDRSLFHSTLVYLTQVTS